MQRDGSAILFLLLPAVTVGLGGCRSRDRAPVVQTGDRAPAPRLRSPTAKSPIRDVACLYDQKPWLSLDKAGDLDPEGIQFRVFLDPGTGRGVLRDGMFHIELYQVGPESEGGHRTLVSDWRYPTSDVVPIKSKVLGMGYHVKLRWASKGIAGHEVELVTRYEAPDGATVAAGTKRLRVPKSNS